MTDNVLQLWRFIRVELPVRDLAHVLKATPGIDALLGADLYRRLLEVGPADEKQLNDLRRALALALDRHHSRRCLCPVLRSDVAIGFGPFRWDELPEEDKWTLPDGEYTFPTTDDWVREEFESLDEESTCPTTDDWVRWAREEFESSEESGHPSRPRPPDPNVGDHGPFTSTSGPEPSLTGLPPGPGSIMRCLRCGEYWYHVEDADYDVFYFHRLSEVELNGIQQGTWQPPVLEQVGHLSGGYTLRLRSGQLWWGYAPF